MGRRSGSGSTGRFSLGRESGSGSTGRSSLGRKSGSGPVRPVGPPNILAGLFLELLLLLNYLSCRNWLNSSIMLLINFSETLGSGKTSKQLVILIHD